MDRKQEDYGEWMVMARCKLMNKARGKQSNPDLSQSDESFQAKSDRPLLRTEEQSKAVGKRKVTHSQPTMSYREESKASLSNQRRVKEVAPNQTRKLRFWWKPTGWSGVE